MSTRTSLFVLALLFAWAPAQADLVAGRDYQTLATSMPTDSPGRIEVLEFFSYGCPHCFDLHPLVSRWSAQLPKDVVFKRVATGFGRPAWNNLAKAYYALQATGNFARLDTPLFDAVQKQRLPLVDKQSIVAWVAKQGVDAGTFAAAFDSFSVNNKVNQAEDLTRKYRVEAVPTLAVGGRYIVLGRTHEEALKIADQLIAKVKAENGRKS
jgi:thiol:disulfide interchange protein DsbA